MAEYSKLLTNRYGLRESWTLRVAEEQGAYAIARRAFTVMSPDEIKATVKDANIRGRGGAGFPAGVKWGFLPKDAQEAGLPGDQRRRGRAGHVQGPHHHGARPAPAGRGLHHRDATRSARTSATSTCATSWSPRSSASRRAIEERAPAGYLGKTPVRRGLRDRDLRAHRRGRVHLRRRDVAAQLARGPARRAAAQAAVPGAVAGAFGCPTIVNNVETIAARPGRRRAWAARSWASCRAACLNDGGVRLYGVSGHVKKPGVYEAPVGLTLRELIYDLGGGMLRRRSAAQGGDPRRLVDARCCAPDDLVDAPDPKSAAARVARQEPHRRADGRRHLPRARHACSAPAARS